MQNEQIRIYGSEIVQCGCVQVFLFLTHFGAPQRIKYIILFSVCLP